MSKYNLYPTIKFIFLFLFLFQFPIPHRVTTLMYRNTGNEPLYAQDNVQDIFNSGVLLKYIKKNNLLLSWDQNYNIGLIRKDNVIVSFQPNFPIVLINFTQQKFISPVITKGNSLIASKEFIDFLDAVFVTKTFPIEKKFASESNATSNKSTSNTTSQKQSQKTVQDNSSSDLNKDEKAKTLSSSLFANSEITNTPDSTGAIKKPTLAPTGTSAFSRVVTLVIDPGHGGKDPGGVGRFVYNKKKYVLMEKDIVLDVATRVKNIMQSQFPNLVTVLTRSKDEFISLEGRTILANKYLDNLKEGEAMMFVSIHANSTLTSSASGYEVWYLPPDYRRDNLVSETLNHSQIYSIINNLREEEITLESKRLAGLVIDGLTSQIGELSRNRGVKEEKFYVVRNTKMPAVLIELGFVTNAEEGHNLTKDEYRDKLSVGIARGLQDYLELFSIIE